MNVEPLDGTFGATVRDIALADLDAPTFDELHELWVEYALLIFPGQHLSKREQDAFARRFGDLEFTAAPISNLDRDGNVHSADDDEIVKSLRGNEGWHHDSTYMPVQAKGAVFSAEIVPSEGAATGWADMRAAYDALDPVEQQRLANLSAHHSLYYSMDRAGLLPVQNKRGGYDQYGYHDKAVPIRPLVKTHPDTGLRNLLIGRHAHDIVGMDSADSEALLDQVNSSAVAVEHTLHHQWVVGDAVVWDNRRLMHRGTPYDMTEPRRMWHTRIAGDPRTETALNHT